MSNENNEWWRGGIIYQVYPRSFCDSEKRGWGDLNGIRGKIPYLASLGVDAIWISPFFKSPMKDFGYDVEDHRKVDPMFGCDEDLEKLIEEAKDAGLRIMVDLVLSHVSDTHPWFMDASRNPNSKYSDYFVWAEPKEDGNPPNNWLSIFGGSAWSWNATRRQYYLHNFLSNQPDLNFHNPKVRREVLSIARYWLERGVSGFRLDTVNFYFHDKELRDNPPTDSRMEALVQESNPYSYQDHVYDKNRPETTSFLEDFGALLREYPETVSLGEIGAAKKRSWTLIQEYTQGARLNLCYTFDLMGNQFNANYLRSVIQRSLTQAPDAWPCWSFSNHDVPRSASRLAPPGVSPEKIAQLTSSILISLRGTPCVYQGEELGLEEAVVPFDLLQDPYGIEFWPDYVGRDGCRTPMPWDHTDSNCGFTETDEPWLPIPVTHRERSVSIQEALSNSTLRFFRRVVSMRAQEPTIQLGELILLEGSDEVLSYERSLHGNTVQCHFNLSDQTVAVEHPGFENTQCFNGTSRGWKDAPTELSLGPWEWIWLKG